MPPSSPTTKSSQDPSPRFAKRWPSTPLGTHTFTTRHTTSRDLEVRPGAGRARGARGVTGTGAASHHHARLPLCGFLTQARARDSSRLRSSLHGTSFSTARNKARLPQWAQEQGLATPCLSSERPECGLGFHRVFLTALHTCTLDSVGIGLGGKEADKKQRPDSLYDP